MRFFLPGDDDTIWSCNLVIFKRFLHSNLQEACTHEADFRKHHMAFVSSSSEFIKIIEKFVECLYRRVESGEFTGDTNSCRVYKCRNVQQGLLEVAK